ncbi:hypothetical protein Tco_1395816 [Tanacetum coccineum]
MEFQLENEEPKFVVESVDEIAFVSVDTYDILTNNEFPIFDIWEKIFIEDDAWVGVILVNGGYGDATNDIHDVWNVTLIKNVLFIRSVEKLK